MQESEVCQFMQYVMFFEMRTERIYLRPSITSDWIENYSTVKHGVVRSTAYFIIVVSDEYTVQ